MSMEISTKGEKTNGKIAGPLFPRLHVDDTKKIGPRAPPRNKMALYEQFSLPSQRFNNTSLKLPPPPIYGRMFTTSSSSQGFNLEMGKLSSFPTSPRKFHTNVRQLKNEMNSENTKGNNSIKRSMVALSETVNLEEIPLPKLSVRPSFETYNHSQLKDEAAGLKISTFLNPSSARDHFQIGANCSLELQNSISKKSRLCNFTNIEDPNLQPTQGHNKTSTPIIQAKDHVFPKFFLKSDFTEEEHSVVSGHPLKRNSELKPSGFDINRDDINLSTQGDKICKGNDTSEEEKSLIDNNGVSCHECLVNTQNSVDEHQHEDKDTSPSHVKSEHRSEDLSQTPVRDGASCVIISSDVLIDMIGQKHFLQARNTIIHHQRIFSMQVFELHRILKVQRMLMDDGNTQLSEHNSSKFANSNLGGFTLAGNQWLIPVFSPSEGLIYKPYPHHIPPPPGGVLATLYNDCSLPDTNITKDDFLRSSPSAVCGRASLDHSYFAPFGMPMINAFTSGSPIKQLTGFNNNIGDGYQSPYVLIIEKNMASEKLAESTTNGIKKNRASNDALPLFPVTPTSFDVGQPIQSSNTDQQKTQVIKVIPLNPKLASESTARIVKLIQDERKNICN